VKDFLTGVLFLFMGLLFYLYSRIYEFGTASNMGPGFYPSLVSGILVLLGIILVVKKFIEK